MASGVAVRPEQDDADNDVAEEIAAASSSSSQSNTPWSKEEDAWVLDAWLTKWKETERTPHGIPARDEGRMFKMFKEAFPGTTRTPRAVRVRLYTITPNHEHPSLATLADTASKSPPLPAKSVSFADETAAQKKKRKASTAAEDDKKTTATATPKKKKQKTAATGDSKAEKLKEADKPVSPLGKTHPLPQPASSSSTTTASVDTAAAAPTTPPPPPPLLPPSAATEKEKSKHANIITLPRNAVALLTKLAEGTHDTLKEATAAITRAKALETDLKKARDDCADAQSRAAKAEAELEATRRAMTSVTINLEESTELVKKLTTNVETCDRALTQSKADLDKARKEYEEDKQDALHRNANAYENQMKHLRSRITALEWNLTQKRQEIAELQESLTKTVQLQVASAEFKAALQAQSQQQRGNPTEERMAAATPPVSRTSDSRT